MSRGSAVALADLQPENSDTLGEQEQERLIRAIESAIDVGRQDQFHAWMRGPFHALLPHDSLVCLELDQRGGTRLVASLHHTPAMELLGHAQHGLAARLALAYRGNRRQTCAADSALIDRGLAHSAVVHLIRLLSGADYCFVLINVPADRVDGCRRLFKLLSSHLKMALSRALGASERKKLAALTPRELEILQLIACGKSNRQISVTLGISAITLKSQVARLYRKLDVQNRADAVARGLAPPSDG